jgi:putative Mg2+ transporter-C (MgtC) family protein
VSRAFGGSDPARIAAQIVTGIGFLGAGVILRLGAKVRGLTTAASVWSVAAIGMAVSAGGPLLVVAVCATLLAYATLTVMARIEHRIAPQSNARVMVVQLSDDAQVSQFVQQLYVLHADVDLVRVRSRQPLVLEVELSSAPDSLLASITGISAVAEAGWEH